MKISEILTEKYKLRIPPTVYYELLADVHEAEEEQEPCKDAISRQAVLDTLDTSDRFMDEDRTVDTYRALLKECYEVLPSVTPKQKTGHWKRISMDKYVQHAMAFYRCSECGEDIIGEHNYCPNCGAKMEESE